MEAPASVIETLIERVEAYGQTTFELTKLKAMDTTATVLTSLVTRMAVIAMFSLFVLLLNIGIALWLGEWLGKFYYGFFVVALFYLIAGIIFHFSLSKWIKKPIGDLMISQTL
jgi:hypothetical protein